MDLSHGIEILREDVFRSRSGEFDDASSAAFVRSDLEKIDFAIRLLDRSACGQVMAKGGA
jgi:hypothetical protein